MYYLSSWLKPLPLSILSIVLCNVGLTPSWAQSITAAPDGTGTVIHHNGNLYTIDGGSQAGANLFHSFQDFGLSANEIADFLSNPSIENVFGRVVSGNPSIIEGLIRLTGGESNLYLMNPAGIVFGAGAQLDVTGDFFATTADQICFETDCFDSFGANDYGQLVGSPATLGFLQGQSGGIINAGTLEVAKGKSLHLTGGTVVNLGAIITPEGTATLAAIPGERRVRLAQPGNLLSVDISDTVLTEGIAPLDLPGLLTTIPNHLQGKAIAPGTVLVDGTVAGVQVDLYAAGAVTRTDAGSVLGKTKVIRFTEAGQNPNQAVFIDRRADHPEALLYGAAAGTVTQIIEQEENGISVISEQLSVISDGVGELESVAIVTEGNAGDFWLGNQWLRSETINDYATQLQTWGESLTTQADLLLYSCFTALGATGEALVASLAELTRADVAASVDATGSANYGADWVLETSTGDIEAGTPFTSGTLAGWEGKLLTRTVTNTNNSGALSLRDALTDSSGGFVVPVADGDTIAFDLAGSPVITLNGEIAWSTDNLTIDGSNVSGDDVVVDGGGNGRVFRIDADNATIQNLTVRNGQVMGFNSGGGIQHSGIGLLTLENSTISSNYGRFDGGGVFSLGSVIVSNSSISGNSTARIGGGIYSQDGILVTDSNITGNTARGIPRDYGGGIFSSGDVTVIDSSFLDNVGSSGGGGISSRQSVDVSNSIFMRNTGRFGGSINSARNLTLSQSTISGGSFVRSGGGVFVTGDIILKDSNITNNSASYRGGAIYNRGSIFIENSTISNNIVTSGSGGGIHSGRSSSPGSIMITNSNIVANYSEDGGGGIRNYGNITIIDSNISDNTAMFFGGGGIYNEHGDVTVENSRISSNLTVGGGGGILSRDGYVDLNNSVVSGNLAGNSGAISSQGGITLVDSVISGNSARFSVGGIGTILIGSGLSKNIVLVNSVISDNTAGNGNGGGVVSAGDLILTNSTVTNNSAKRNGGGIHIRNNINSNNSTVFSNTAGDEGGGINNFLGTITLVNSTVSNNSAQKSGGGIRAHNGPVILNNATIADNTSGADGGGIFSNGTYNNRIQNSIIANNVDSGTAPDISADLSTSTVEHSLIKDTKGITGLSLSTGIDGNIINIDPLLSPLANHGGTIQTHALLPGSPAIDSGNNSLTTTATDQRGNNRIINGTVDMGAFESQGFILSVTDGDNQSTTVGQAFGTDLEVTVTSNYGEPVSGGQVTFSAANSGASLDTTTSAVTIDSSGLARLAATANTVAGDHTVTPTASGSVSAVEFNLTNHPDAPASLDITNGNNQNTIVATPFTDRLQVEVKDQYGNRIPNATVNFTTPSSGASLATSPGSVTTDANGIATLTAAANTVAGDYRIQAEINSLTADFGLTNQPDKPAKLTATGGNNQTTTVNTAFTENLEVTITDQFGNPIRGATVTLTAPSSGASAIAANTTLITNDQGKVATTITANTVSGAYTLTADAAALPTAQFTLGNTAGEPRRVTVMSGNHQTAPTNQAFGQSLRIRITDEFNNPIANENVTFTVPSLGASGILSNPVVTTDSNGVATVSLTANGESGSYTVQAVSGSQSATLTLTNAAQQTPITTVPTPQPTTGTATQQPTTTDEVASQNSALSNQTILKDQKAASDPLMSACPTIPELEIEGIDQDVEVFDELERDGQIERDENCHELTDLY
ncbi:MAG: DUF4347 domain-containing protein [Spirulina sp. SIO3F2]|nr:DUF4347 domain-containing protein [Spirulina sp. SIO3F2]